MKNWMYIAITNKIVIANVSDTFTRIQTIAHECLHSIQDRKILIFNFIFSNIYLLYYVVICVLALFNLLPFKMMFLSIFLILSLINYIVRMYLENDAMIKARFLAKEYLEEENISSKKDVDEMVNGFDDLNNLDASNAILLDVRTKKEYLYSPTKHSINIPLDELRDNVSLLSKDKKIYIICHSGVRSYNAYRILSNLGFDCYNFSGGYIFYQAFSKLD